MGALDTAVRQGKALYAGISSYSAPRAEEAVAILRDLVERSYPGHDVVGQVARGQEPILAGARSGRDAAEVAVRQHALG